MTVDTLENKDIPQNIEVVPKDKEQPTDINMDNLYRPIEGEVEPDDGNWTRQDLFNVGNPIFGTKFNTGLNSYNPEESSWDPENTPWVKELRPEDKLIVSTANSEEYAIEKLKRKGTYEDSQKRIAEDPSWTPDILSMGTSFIDPTIFIPIGVTATATKAAYTVASKATKLAALSAESATVSVASATLYEGAMTGSGVGQGEYGTMNMYAMLIGGGLPLLGNMVSGGYHTAQTAKALTSDPKNFAAIFGEVTAEKLGGTQLKNLYTRLVPDILKSDVVITASSNNQYITLMSNRIDSPPMAVYDKNTGKPVAIPTTGQDYKGKFNGRQTMTKADIRGFHAQSTIKNEDDFNIEVGRVIRARAAKQDQAVYDEVEEMVAFTKNDAKLKKKAEREAFKNERVAYYIDSKGKHIPLTEEDLALIKDDMLTKNGYTTEVKTKPSHTAKELKKFDEDLKIRIKEEITAKVDAEKELLYDKHQLEFEHADPQVVAAAKRTDDYFKEVLEEGHRLSIAELKAIKANRHYMTRIFDFQKIREIDYDVLVSKLAKSLKSHASNRNVSAEDIAISAKEVATTLKKLDFTREWADHSFFVPKELGSTAYLKTKIKLDDTMLEDILVSNIDDVLGQYSYSQSGHFSANHAFPELQGIPREEQLDVFREKFIEPLISTGASAKEVQSLKNMFEDMLGTFRIAKESNSVVWKSTRIMNSINSLTYGGGFALNTAGELGGLLLDGEVSNFMRGRLGALKEINHMFTGKTIEDPFVRDMVLMGQLENLVETNNMLKLSDTENVFNVNKVEHNINKGVSEFFKYTGLRGATVALEAMVGSKIVHDIIDIGSMLTIPVRHEKYLARIGLSLKQVQDLSAMFKKHGEFNKSGKIFDMHLDLWDDASLDNITTALSRGVKHTVIKGDTTYLPSYFIKPNAFNKIVFQFLRYPMAATETLLARGIDESPARWMAAMGTSASLMAMVMWGREKAAITVGALDEEDAKFQDFWKDDEAAKKLFAVSMAKVGVLGGVGIFTDRLSAVSGVPAPGSEYVTKDVLGAFGNATFGRLPQARDILEPALMRGEFNNKKQWSAIMALTPAASVPLVSEYLRSQIKERTH